MRIVAVCHECVKLGLKPAYYNVHINDDGVYHSVCPNGHNNIFRMQGLQYEILFDVALNAIVDLYYREAISSFASSVEAFFVLANNIFCNHLKADRRIIARASKAISRYSERQLGAYIMLYVAILNEMPLLLTDEQTKLRNSVIHAGILPTRENAIYFGEACYKVIQEGIKRLRAVCDDAVTIQVALEVVRVREKHGDRFPVVTLSDPTRLNILNTNPDAYPPFVDYLSSKSLYR